MCEGRVLQHGQQTLMAPIHLCKHGGLGVPDMPNDEM